LVEHHHHTRLVSRLLY